MSEALSEYFLIEYRQRLGFDTGVPVSGVLIYSVDLTIPADRGCSGTSCRTYRVQVVEADGRNDLLRTGLEGGNRGEPSDAFGWGNSPRRFAANTTPAARSRNGALTTFTIHDIEVDEAARVARVRLSTAATPAFIRVDGADTLLATPRTVAMVLRAAGGALPYSWSATQLPTGVELSVFAATDSAVLRGPINQMGVFFPQVSVRDALGTSAQASLDWLVGTPAITPSIMLRRLLQGGASSALGAFELAYLDRLGNRNGRFDIGDARAELGRTP